MIAWLQPQGFPAMGPSPQIVNYRTKSKQEDEYTFIRSSSGPLSPSPQTLRLNRFNLSARLLSVLAVLLHVRGLERSTVRRSPEYDS